MAAPRLVLSGGLPGLAQRFNASPNGTPLVRTINQPITSAGTVNAKITQSGLDPVASR